MLAPLVLWEMGDDKNRDQQGVLVNISYHGLRNRVSIIEINCEGEHELLQRT
jgi:hypothetical protein